MAFATEQQWDYAELSGTDGREHIVQLVSKYLANVADVIAALHASRALHPAAPTVSPTTVSDTAVTQTVTVSQRIWRLVCCCCKRSDSTGGGGGQRLLDDM
eukprot:TRINITY_DN3137_c0_g1_i2.p3 TRINITY_DN3137_c0_g1~~TRINITY_DN3137_c0_g1_i2.p3  ORF type:complete len:101 (-),score=22.78 TRINITY_DN3137_c0_g1_i2:46-348(-)